MPQPEDAWTVLGRISGVHGVRGWVKVFSFTQERDGILDYPHWYLGSEHRPVRVVEGRLQGGGVVARLEGIEDRDLALGLVGREIAVPASPLPPLPAGEYYWFQLQGLAVVNLSQECLGRVSGLLETGANDVLVVQDEQGTEILIPWDARAAAGVDLEQGRITVDWQRDW
ncbi:MAG: ribosome maturation factor RimM [Acidithiobacillus sp.]